MSYQPFKIEGITHRKVKKKKKKRELVIFEIFSSEYDIKCVEMMTLQPSPYNHHKTILIAEFLNTNSLKNNRYIVFFSSSGG